MGANIFQKNWKFTIASVCFFSFSWLAFPQAAVIFDKTERPLEEGKVPVPRNPPSVSCWMNISVMDKGIWTQEMAANPISLTVPLTVEGRKYRGGANWKARRGGYDIAITFNYSLRDQTFAYEATVRKNDVVVSSDKKTVDTKNFNIENGFPIADVTIGNQEVWRHFAGYVKGASEKDDLAVHDELRRLQDEGILPKDYFPTEFHLGCHLVVRSI